MADVKWSTRPPC